MKEIILDSHSERCINKEFNKKGVIIETWANPHRYCGYNPEIMLFYLNGDFVLLTFYNCIIESEPNKYDAKALFINSILKKSKIVKNAETFREPDIEEELKKIKYISNLKMKLVTEINYLYSGLQKRHAIVSKVELIQSYLNRDEIYENYKKAKLYLELHYPKHLFLFKELELLHSYNSMLHYPSSAVVLNTIDHLIKHINNI